MSENVCKNELGRRQEMAMQMIIDDRRLDDDPYGINPYTTDGTF